MVLPSLLTFSFSEQRRMVMAGEEIVFEADVQPSGMRPFIGEGMSPEPTEEFDELVDKLRKFGIQAGTRVEAGYLQFADVVRKIQKEPLSKQEFMALNDSLRTNGLFVFRYKERGNPTYYLALCGEDTHGIRNADSILIPLDDNFLRDIPNVSRDLVYGMVLPKSEFDLLAEMLFDLKRQSTYLNELSDENSAEDLYYSIIGIAIRIGASDIHIEPLKENWRVRLRVNGVLRELPQRLPNNLAAALVGVIQNDKAQLSYDNPRKPRGSDIKFDAQEVARFKYLENHSLRLSILPIDPEEKRHDVVMRVLSKSANIDFSIASLKFEPRTEKCFRRVLRTRKGLVLVTGPTGSGKTTTLYTALNEVNTEQVKVITLEDPVEYRFDKMSQVPIDAKSGADFGDIMRSVLRHDPDVILVGEIRDAVTAVTAVRAANTGHLVFSTLHTNDAVSALTRLSDFEGVSVANLADALRAISAQRLVPLCCPHCSEPADMRYELNELLGLADAQAIDFEVPWMKIGAGAKRGKCLHCGGLGLIGRKAIVEFWEVTAEDRILMVNDIGNLGKFRQRAIDGGMKPLWATALEYAIKEKITLDDMLQATTPEELASHRDAIREALRKRYAKALVKV